MNTTIIKSAGQSIVKFAGKNAPIIFTSISIGGVVTSVVLAVKATPKAIDLIEEAGAYKTVDKIKAAWMVYIPSFISILITISCILLAHKVTANRLTALASLYTLSEKNFKEYKDKVVEQIGESKEQSVKDEIAKDIVEKIPLEESSLIITDSGDVTCLDALSGRYFKSNMEAIRRAQNNINKLIIDQVWATLNDFYYELDLPPIELGKDCGWNSDHMVDLNFSSQIAEDGTPVLVVFHEEMPRWEWMK